jgi:hypothetical protein
MKTFIVARFECTACQLESNHLLLRRALNVYSGFSPRYVNLRSTVSWNLKGQRVY